jgi:co-chaperonin GroES (HSP10)
MVNKKEKVECIKPTGSQVLVGISIPKELVTESGIILQSKIQEKFKGIQLYQCKLISKGPNAPDNLNIGSLYLIDVLAGAMIPSEGNLMIKVTPYESLIGETKEGKMKVENFVPNKERVLVKMYEVTEEVTKSGIIIPETVSQSHFHALDTYGGTVVAVSNDVTDIKVGDVIRWEAHVGIDIQFEEKSKYKSIPAAYILAKIEE